VHYHFEVRPVAIARSNKTGRVERAIPCYPRRIPRLVRTPISPISIVRPTSGSRRTRLRIPEALAQPFRRDLNTESLVKSGSMGNTLPG
jgi:hypothetical protein